jgi:hypothetical protein
MSAEILLEQASPNRGSLYSRRREERLDFADTEPLSWYGSLVFYGVTFPEDNRLNEERMQFYGKHGLSKNG